ncbi:hypothetical protein [uncultured Lamprocystis sp.]|jgi:hypothetical protein|uniref:hypothetical protein n=1 Tax=uncultured Lamprocystis sp. TaxID=543132 RepID=UPI0025D1A1AC|nr:hypothetical protein [uncultured Lamprocystis sp.]
MTLVVHAASWLPPRNPRGGQAVIGKRIAIVGDTSFKEGDMITLDGAMPATTC